MLPGKCYLHFWVLSGGVGVLRKLESLMGWRNESKRCVACHTLALYLLQRGSVSTQSECGCEWLINIRQFGGWSKRIDLQLPAHSVCLSVERTEELVKEMLSKNFIIKTWRFSLVPRLSNHHPSQLGYLKPDCVCRCVKISILVVLATCSTNQSARRGKKRGGGQR